MNTGQSLFSIGALLLLSLTILRVNNSILSTDTVMQNSKFGILATSIATSVIEKASKKFFDSNVTEDPVFVTTAFTAPGSLGHAWNEVPPDNCNDFDDFKGYKDTVDNLRSDIYYVSCDVYYINPLDPETKSNVQTWHKRMTVTVKPKSDTTNVFELSSIYSYWHFR